MSLQKALCLICERPTADGAVLAVHVDKEKLQQWFLNVSEYELEEIKDDDLICYFCIWHAEFLWEFDDDDVMMDEELVWWPRNSDYSDDATKELRKNYFDGKLEQCWVQLEKIDPPESDGEGTQNVEAETRPRRWKCIYCGKRFKYSYQLSRHLKNLHNEAIRCENRNCATYFHTLEEKKEHTKNFHENPEDREKIDCCFCGKEFEGPQNYNHHVRRVHKDFPVKCSHFGCSSFFKSKIEMKTHFDSAHGEDDEARKFKCNDCDYKAMQKGNLEQHIAYKHLPKYMKCKMCEKMYSTEFSLRMHVKQFHKCKVCSYCKLDVSIVNMKRYHLKIKKCIRCKSKFKCSGLYRMHLESCRNIRFKCGKCSKSFNLNSHLAYHTRKNHER